MIATNRRIPAHDFLLVAFSVAVIVLSNWPETEPRQLVQLRDRDGTLRQYSLAEKDPTLSKLRLALEKWAKAGQETRLAVAQWRAELADFYAEKTVAPPEPTPSPIRPAAFRSESRPMDEGANREERNAEVVPESRSQHEYWRAFGQQARVEIEKIQEIRRSRKALEVPQPIVFGALEPGRKPTRAILISPAIGFVVALGFAAWSSLCPTLRLRKHGLSSCVASTEFDGDAASELRLVVPSTWVRIRQPTGVLARWGAMTILSVYAFVSVVASA